MELYWNFPCHELSKPKAKMEVSKSELYYTTKQSFRKHQKGIVCGTVAKFFDARLKLYWSTVFKMRVKIVENA